MTKLEFEYKGGWYGAQGTIFHFSYRVRYARESYEFDLSTKNYWSRIPTRFKLEEDIQSLCQFIEDNYKTLTLEQLDNIEEVYKESKRK